MRLMYSQQLICILATRGGSLSSATFSQDVLLYSCVFVLFLVSLSDAKCFLRGTSAPVYYREGCTSSLNPAHHRRGLLTLTASLCVQPPNSHLSFPYAFQTLPNPLPSDSFPALC